jgi:hypothetical protein
MPCDNASNIDAGCRAAGAGTPLGTAGAANGAADGADGVPVVALDVSRRATLAAGSLVYEVKRTCWHGISGEVSPVTARLTAEKTMDNLNRWIRMDTPAFAVKKCIRVAGGAIPQLDRIKPVADFVASFVRTLAKLFRILL